MFLYSSSFSADTFPSQHAPPLLFNAALLSSACFFLLEMAGSFLKSCFAVVVNNVHEAVPFTLNIFSPKAPWWFFLSAHALVRRESYRVVLQFLIRDRLGLQRKHRNAFDSTFLVSISKPVKSSSQRYCVTSDPIFSVSSGQ